MFYVPFSLEVLTILRDLTDAQRGKVYDALAYYQAYSVYPEFKSRLLRTVFRLVAFNLGFSLIVKEEERENIEGEIIIDKKVNNLNSKVNFNSYLAIKEKDKEKEKGKEKTSAADVPGTPSAATANAQASSAENTNVAQSASTPTIAGSAPVSGKASVNVSDAPESVAAGSMPVSGKISVNASDAPESVVAGSLAVSGKASVNVSDASENADADGAENRAGTMSASQASSSAYSPIVSENVENHYLTPRSNSSNPSLKPQNAINVEKVNPPYSANFENVHQDNPPSPVEGVGTGREASPEHPRDAYCPTGSVRPFSLDASSGIDATLCGPEPSDAECSFDAVWKLYGKDVGDMTYLRGRWARIGMDERRRIVRYIREYVRVRPKVIFRRNFRNFLDMRIWETEPLRVYPTSGSTSAHRSYASPQQQAAPYAGSPTFGTQPPAAAETTEEGVRRELERMHRDEEEYEELMKGIDPKKLSEEWKNLEV